MIASTGRGRMPLRVRDRNECRAGRPGGQRRHGGTARRGGAWVLRCTVAGSPARCRPPLDWRACRAIRSPFLRTGSVSRSVPTARPAKAGSPARHAGIPRD